MKKKLKEKVIEKIRGYVPMVFTVIALCTLDYFVGISFLMGFGFVVGWVIMDIIDVLINNWGSKK